MFKGILKFDFIEPIIELSEVLFYDIVIIVCVYITWTGSYNSEQAYIGVCE